MTGREQQGREYVADVLGEPWEKVAAAMNRLELDPKRRLEDPVSRESRRRAWAAHMEAHRRAAEWWARNRPGVVVDPGTTRHLDGVATRCLLRGSCGFSCYCEKAMWARGRVPAGQVVNDPLVEATESELWKRHARVTYVNEGLVREELAKGPVRVTLAPEVAAALGRALPDWPDRTDWRRARESALWRERMRAGVVPDDLIGAAGEYRTVVGVDPAHGDAGMVVGAVDPDGRVVHVVGPVHPYLHWPEHGVIPDRREYFNQRIDPDAGPVQPGTEPCV